MAFKRPSLRIRSPRKDTQRGYPVDRRRTCDAWPKSKCVLIEKPFGKPVVCNDGVTIAKEITLKCPEENLGASMMREAAERTGDAVGDGTSTATILLTRFLRKASVICSRNKCH